ncbi:zinc finger and SCAN domain containing 18, partial [Homo sapiens]
MRRVGGRADEDATAAGSEFRPLAASRVCFLRSRPPVAEPRPSEGLWVLAPPEPTGHLVIPGTSPLEPPCPWLDSHIFQCRFGKMLPLEKAFASPRSSPAPPDLPTPGSAAGVQ